MIYLETSRLILRNWHDEDAFAFTEMNQDPAVMRYFPAIWTEERSIDFMVRMNQQFEKRGFTFFACELQQRPTLIGFVGLNVPNFESHFTPCVEIGWRLMAPHWGNGYATEAATALLEVAFLKHQLNEIVAFTIPSNKPSLSVMKKIGMKHDIKGDFSHPAIAPEHPMSRQVLYRIQKQS